MKRADIEYCSDCAYLDRHLGISLCDYLLRTGHPRSIICPYGVGCTEHSKLHPERKINPEDWQLKSFPILSDEKLGIRELPKEVTKGAFARLIDRLY